MSQAKVKLFWSKSERNLARAGWGALKESNYSPHVNFDQMQNNMHIIYNSPRTQKAASEPCIRDLGFTKHNFPTISMTWKPNYLKAVKNSIRTRAKSSHMNSRRYNLVATLCIDTHTIYSWLLLSSKLWVNERRYNSNDFQTNIDRLLLILSKMDLFILR